MIKDLIFLPPLVTIVLLICLFFFFRNFSGMLLPLLSVGIACLWTFGMMALAKIPLTMISTAMPVALMAVGVGYGVHVVENVFADSSAGKKGKTEMKITLMRIAIPVIIAGLTELTSFLSLCSWWVVPLTQFGMSSAFGFTCAMVLVLTFIPAVLSADRPRRQDIYRPPPHQDRHRGPDPEEALLHKPPQERVDLRDLPCGLCIGPS